MNTPLPFENFNETDVREEVIAPLLRRLGYQSGGTNDIIREQSLRYPKLSLGRKNPKKDPPLRGKADYILEINKRLRWVIEAKAPNITIGYDHIEQAWTYANHPEIRSLYFVLCNGRALNVYRTAHAPDAPAVLSLPYERLEADFQILANLLAPDALIRDFPNIEPDTALPIAKGLRSVARITNGVIRYEKNSLESLVLNELQTSIEGGAVERDTAGRLVVYLRTVNPSRSIQELNERLGLSVFEMTSESTQLSNDPAHPTLFTYKNHIILPAKEEILDMNTWTLIQLPFNVNCDLEVHAAGTFTGHVLSGTFGMDMQYLEFHMNIKISGSFEVHVA